MNTSEQLASLDGQQYLVLRPSGPVAELYEREQDAALQRADVRHPYTGHVTLRGFYEPQRREELASLVREWAAVQPPIDVTVEAVDVFPAPWQILILRLARSATLVSAYASLTRALDATDFRRLGELSLEEWTFHLSALYGKTLEPREWDALEAASVRELADRPTETIDEIELVSYDSGAEYAEVIRLGD
ncbi:2'-5' RNA ligase family protein [Microbacterium hydrocarbonoxydans]|uniref:2'-5' RNA ligase family protein n=1 Tax=Microbacterium hydrocarbonoxydans TaxID=273678 RepID=UPI00203E9089|nr:2'-5' RNA ligase family protein [Microbacterium hydrocarbonoxydans]MCM3781220.1 2'-5' RNA ligase family protein [Microbacterium hydrocarbonoxydans]